MRAKILRTAGYCLEALAEIDSESYLVMDEVTSDDAHPASVSGKTFDVEFTYLMDGNETWEEMFSGNPARRKGLERIEGWKYRAYGEIVSVDPVFVDCGVAKLERPFSTHDERVLGEFVSFEVT